MSSSLQRVEFLTTIPSQVPEGQVLCHNQVYPPADIPGVRGSVCWIQAPSDRLKPCECGWAPDLSPHYRVTITGSMAPTRGLTRSGHPTGSRDPLASAGGSGIGPTMSTSPEMIKPIK
jgi:hypothetical protein